MTKYGDAGFESTPQIGETDPSKLGIGWNVGDFRGRGSPEERARRAGLGQGRLPEAGRPSTDPARVAGDATLASSKNDLEGETYLMADSSSLPGLKRATFLALIWMVSPVWGLRPTRALRLLE